MSDLRERLQQDMKAALKNKETDKLRTVRSIIAAIKQKEIDERIESTDETIVKILNKLAKQRKESISQYEKAERSDLVDIEQTELEIIEHYLPEPLTDEEVNAAIESAIQETGATSMKDMGRLMACVQTALQGRADMSKVSQLVRQQLA